MPGLIDLIGNETGQTTTAGRPVFRKGDANVSELSITLPVAGVWVNVPSIHDGKEYGEDEIMQMLMAGKIKPTSIHKTMEEAVNAAKKRSSGLLGEME